MLPSYLGLFGTLEIVRPSTWRAVELAEDRPKSVTVSLVLKTFKIKSPFKFEISCPPLFWSCRSELAVTTAAVPSEYFWSTTAGLSLLQSSAYGTNKNRGDHRALGTPPLRWFGLLSCSGRWISPTAVCLWGRRGLAECVLNFWSFLAYDVRLYGIKKSVSTNSPYPTYSTSGR